MLTVLKNILILGGLIGIAAFGYFLFVLNQDSSLGAEDAEISQALAAEASDFLRRLNDLKTISLETEVLQNERFTSLIDFSMPFPIEQIGRTNPFESN